MGLCGLVLKYNPFSKRADVAMIAKARALPVMPNLFANIDGKVQKNEETKKKHRGKSRGGRGAQSSDSGIYSAQHFPFISSHPHISFRVSRCEIIFISIS